MRELPILMNADRVRAILDGRMTQDRRPIKLPKFVAEESGDKAVWSLGRRPASYDDNEFAFIDMAFPIETYPTYAKAPYQVRDRLYARETLFCKRELPERLYFDVLYSADNVHCEPYGCDGHDGWLMNYKGWWNAGDNKVIIPNIHMPKNLARIWLEVTGVRAELLWDTTEADAKAEGFKSIAELIKYMEELHPKLKGVNFWNWVTEFKRIKKD